MSPRFTARARAMVLDRIHHRLFLNDGYNHRSLVFQLDPANRVDERSAQWVLGQPDLHTSKLLPTSSRTLKVPLAIAYDEVGELLFISDGYGNRLLVFDAAPAIGSLYPIADAACWSSTSAI